MLSRLLKYIVPPFSFRVFFRRIFYSNLRKVPFDKPLLFVGNHQNSFMDGILVGSYLPQPLHFLMRADMFRKPFARFCLRELNVAPVYRIEEGIENVHKNHETFEGIHEILKGNGNLVVFSEGICVQEKRLQKLRKGTARMAFGAEEKYGLDVHIVPVGINYTYPSSFRKEVMISFHEAFSIKELKEEYKANPAKALLAFNQKVFESLQKQVIIVDHPENDWLVEHLLIMERNNCILPFLQWRFDTDDRLILEKSVCERINHLTRTDKNKVKELTDKMKVYTEMLEKNCIRDENVARKLDYGFLRFFALIAAFPLFVTGYFSNIVPFILPKFICNRLVKDKRFYSSIYVSSGTVLYLIYFPVIIILASFFFGFTGFFLSLLMPLAGYLALFYQEVGRERFHYLRFQWKTVNEKNLTDELKNRRRDILDLIRKIDFSES